MSIRLTGVLVLLLAYCAGQALAQGPIFPFYDNCRRSPYRTPRKLSSLRPKYYPEGIVEFCFVITVTDQPCEPQVFMDRTRRVTARCCDTTFAKIKFYVDPACRAQFMGSNLTVPDAPQFNKRVAPSWDRRPFNYTEVKYTQFGPVPQASVNGTSFCLTLKQEGACNVTNLLSISHPSTRVRKLFKVALYDRKVDNYECCPTFTYSFN